MTAQINGTNDPPRRRLTKNEKKRLKKKAVAKKDQQDVTGGQNGSLPTENGHAPPPPPPEDDLAGVDIEYVSASSLQEDMEEFKAIFEKFASVEEMTGKKKQDGDPSENAADPVEAAKAAAKAIAATATFPEEEEADEAGKKKLSRKARKKMSRLSVAELKQLVVRPDVVEAHDVTAADPRLLVYLKSYRNSVPVPRHWCHKRKYLQGKRGIEKAPFQLPEFIGATGIEKIRTAVMEQEESLKSKQKMRAKVTPKTGRIDIDYQVLHDAFFKYQTKPQLTLHGDMYYEGKEFEVKLREKKPGLLSGGLKTALGMPENAPPPWLINMQRYGPPPSYPNLKIPGLNAPIPEGSQFGYHPGGWGKPPVDEMGRPLYGDVFGQADPTAHDEQQVDRALWGDLGSDEEEEEEEEEEDEPEDDVTDMSGLETPSTEAGISSVTSGLDTPESIDLRKRAGTDTPDTSGIASAPKELYQVVQEKQARVGSGLFGTDKKYSMPTEDVQVALNPDQLRAGVSEEFLADKYSSMDGTASVGSAAGSLSGVDSSLLDEEQRKRKRKAEKEKDAKKKSKYGDFKF